MTTRTAGSPFLPLRSFYLPGLAGSLALLVSFATRLALLWLTDGGAVPVSAWPGLFGMGFVQDVLVAVVLVLPWGLFFFLLPAYLRSGRAGYVAATTMFWIYAFSLIFGALSEITFWQEFSTRFNFIAVDYLLYTHEVLGNIRESYPVGTLLALVAAASTASVWALRVRLRSALAVSVTPIQRLAGACVMIGAASMVIVLPQPVLRDGNVYVSELARNGLYSLAQAMHSNELDYDLFYATMPQEEADAVLAGVGVQRAPLSKAASKDMYDDADDLMPFKRKPKNVVLITVESLSAKYVGAYGAEGGLTPNLDRLANQGLMFDNVYAAGTRTVRGLEALSLGTPPIPGQAIVRRPGNEGLSTLGEILGRQGMSPLFIYGGYGYFDNMNAYFGANDYRVVDRRDFPKESVAFENVWGVADESLYDNALIHIGREYAAGKPFFAHIMTTSNHRPYTYPDGRIDIASPGGRQGAVKYTDYAIGRFIEQARTQPWFEDTLFVIVADHCASVAGKTRIPVASYRIPMIFYAPALIDPGHVDTMVSQIDLAPTLVEALGKRGDDHFFGRSLFEKGEHAARAFVSNYQDLGYLRDGVLTVLSPKRKISAWKIDPSSFEASPIAVDAQHAKEAIAYYQTASRAFRRGALIAGEIPHQLAGSPQVPSFLQ